MSSTQVNFRIPVRIKNRAQKKAEGFGMNLSEIMKLFLEKFAEENVLQIQRDIAWEQVFDKGVASHYLSKKGVTTARKINALLEEAGL